MIHALVIAAVMALPTGAESTGPTPSNLAAYKEAKAGVGRDADAHVRLALWCEARGLNAERTKHLTIATLIDPAHATARGLLGMVQYKGKWFSPDVVAKKIQADPDQQARIREYLERRVKAADKADDQMKLAAWCDQNDLNDQATAHYYRAVQLDPGRELAWKHLGYKKEKGRWVKPEQVAAAKEMIELQTKANKHWKPMLEKLRTGLSSRSAAEREKAQAALNEIKEPAAVPAVWAVFAQGNAKHQEVAVKLFGQIDAPSASQALALLAVSGRSADVRRESVVILKRRDPRDFVEVLIAMIRKPIEYEVRHKAGPASPGELLVKGSERNLSRVYTHLAPPSFAMRPSDSIILDANGLPVLSRYLGSNSTPINNWSVNVTGMDRNAVEQGILSGAAAPVNALKQQIAAQQQQKFAAAGLPAGVGAQLSQAVAGAQVPYSVSRSGLTDGPVLNATESIVRNVYMYIPIGQMQAEAQQSAEISRQRLAADVQQIEAYNSSVRTTNRTARQVLTDSTGTDLGENPESWRPWVASLMGVALVTTGPTDEEVPTDTEEIPSGRPSYVRPAIVERSVGVSMNLSSAPVYHHHCFAAGTPVRTADGPRPIETLKSGDRVLTQNTTTGRMAFSPVLNPIHNPPNETLKIQFEDQGKSVVATGIHRFWKVGQGWAMARDLNPGDVLRAIGGTAKVRSIESDRKQPVFNLRVAEGESFFVGDLGILAHDNSLVNPTDKPFDRVAPELASAGRK